MYENLNDLQEKCAALKWKICYYLDKYNASGEIDFLEKAKLCKKKLFELQNLICSFAE